MKVNHLTFTPEQFLRKSMNLKRGDLAIFVNMEQGTLWVARSLREFLLVKLLRDSHEAREILKHFCPVFRMRKREVS